MSNIRKRYRIKSHFRFISFITLSVLMLICISTAIFSLGSNQTPFLSEASEPEVFQTVTVEYGDTLWEIAEKYGMPGQDIRQTVYEICKENEISADTLQPGQLLIIPA